MFQKIFSHLKTNLLNGIILIIPFTITISVLIAVFNFLDNLILKMPFIEKTTENSIFVNYIYLPGIGVLLLLILVYIGGLFNTFLISKNIIKLVNNIIIKLPFIGILYKTIQEATTLLISSKKHVSQQVVLVDFPRSGMKSLGLVTGKVKNKNSTIYSIYVTTTPNPTSGYLLFAPKHEITFTDIPSEEAMKIIVSGGIINLDSLEKHVENFTN